MVGQSSYGAKVPASRRLRLAHTSPRMFELRRQLSLYVAQPESAALEALRAVLDPVQQSLIPAHVTLAREGDFDAASDLEWRERIARLRAPCVRLAFGGPEPLHQHGVILRCIEGEDAYDALRRRVIGPTALPMSPHITLAHPRNPRAPGNSLASPHHAGPGGRG